MEPVNLPATILVYLPQENQENIVITSALMKSGFIIIKPAVKNVLGLCYQEINQSRLQHRI